MESRDDFYVYLSSKSNSNEFPLNKNNAFTNVIKPTLQFNGEFDVALENIIFDPNLILIKKMDTDFEFSIEVNFINDVGEMKGIYNVHYKPTKNIYGNTIEDLIINLNKDMISFLKDGVNVLKKSQSTFISVKDNHVYFTPLSLKKYKGYEKYVILWSFGESLQSLFGLSTSLFGENFELLKKGEDGKICIYATSLDGLSCGPEEIVLNTLTKPYATFPATLPIRINCMHVYCDFIEPSYLGGQTVHLLDIIPLKHMYSKNGTLTMFKRVTKTILDDISIRITNEDGGEIPFNNEMNVVIVLHFKRVM